MKKQKVLLVASGDLQFKPSEIMQSDCADLLPNLFINCEEDLKQVKALGEENERRRKIMSEQERAEELKL